MRQKSTADCARSCLPQASQGARRIMEAKTGISTGRHALFHQTGSRWLRWCRTLRTTSGSYGKRPGSPSSASTRMPSLPKRSPGGRRTRSRGVGSPPWAHVAGRRQAFRILTHSTAGLFAADLTTGARNTAFCENLVGDVDVWGLQETHGGYNDFVASLPMRTKRCKIFTSGCLTTGTGGATIGFSFKWLGGRGGPRTFSIAKLYRGELLEWKSTKNSSRVSCGASAILA